MVSNQLRIQRPRFYCSLTFEALAVRAHIVRHHSPSERLVTGDEQHGPPSELVEIQSGYLRGLKNGIHRRWRESYL